VECARLGGFGGPGKATPQTLGKAPGPPYADALAVSCNRPDWVWLLADGRLSACVVGASHLALDRRGAPSHAQSTQSKPLQSLSAKHAILLLWHTTTISRIGFARSFKVKAA